MGVLSVLFYDEDRYSILTTRGNPVTKFDEELHMIVQDLRDTLVDAAGAGLAAPQIGYAVRVAVIANGPTLINPEIIEKYGSVVDYEGCLSIPNLVAPVARAESVKVRSHDMDGDLVEFNADGFEARVMQHEIDHLDGILMFDRLDEVNRRRARNQLARCS